MTTLVDPTKLDIYFIITTCTVKVSPPKVAGRNFMSQGARHGNLAEFTWNPSKRDSKPGCESMRQQLSVCEFVCVLHHSCYFIFVFHLTLVFSSSSLLDSLALMPHFFCLNSLLYIFKWKSMHPYFLLQLKSLFSPYFESCSSAWSGRDINIHSLAPRSVLFNKR